jgi:hypothetical protein
MGLPTVPNDFPKNQTAKVGLKLSKNLVRVGLHRTVWRTGVTDFEIETVFFLFFLTNQSEETETNNIENRDHTYGGAIVPSTVAKSK